MPVPAQPPPAPPADPDGPLWLGVDVGTQSLRVSIVDTFGRPVAGAAVPLASTRRDGRHEQDPEQWWHALVVALRTALAGTGLRAAAASGAGPPGATSGSVAASGSGVAGPLGGRLAGLAVCSTSGTIVATAPSGAPLGPALMYDDARAAAEVPAILAAGAGTWARLGYTIQPTWALPRLRWLLREARLSTMAGARVCHCADFLAGRLAGAPVATDWSHALKTGYDVDGLRWPDEVLDRLGIPTGLLPPVVAPGTPIGTVGRAAAAETGLPEGLPVHAGLTDGCAAQVAAGAVHPGAWNSVLGTTLVVKGVTASRLADPGGAVYSHRHPEGGWLPGGASSVGAGVLRAEFPDGDPAALDAAAARHEPACAVAYPLAGRGERFPFVAPEAVSFVTGTPRGTGERYAAVLQGVAFTERLCYDRLSLLGADVDGPLSVTGGGSRSAYWCRLRATILRRPLRRPAHSEPAFGMAVVAASGAPGSGGLAATARRMAQPADLVQPGPAEPFARAYRRFVTELARRGYIGEDLVTESERRWH